MEIHSATLIGLGAMGSFFAPGLCRTLGENFFVIADGARLERLRTRGVVINGARPTLHLLRPSEGRPVDLLILAVKDTGLRQAVADAARFVGPRTQILCVMNGVDSEQALSAAYGPEHVLYSYMRMSIEMKDGVADYDPEAGLVHFGERRNEGAPTERVAAIQKLFTAAGIRWQTDPDMIYGIWYKYMCNVGENLTCALFGVPFGAFRTSAHANFFRRSLMREVVEVANKKGIPLTPADMDRQERTLKILPFYNEPSTLQDLRRSRPTEVGMFAGRMVEMGRELGVATPFCRMFLEGIRLLEEKHAGRITDGARPGTPADV